MTFNFNDTEGATPQDRIVSNTEISETIESISPHRLHGLCFWIDGQYNTRQGANKSKTYMEDLVQPYNSQSNQIGYSEYTSIGFGNVWDGDFLTLKTWANYPQAVNKEMTIEAVFKTTKQITATTCILTTAYVGGSQLYITSNNQLCLSAREEETDSYLKVYIDEPIEINKPYYAVGKVQEGKEVYLSIKNINAESSVPLKTFKYPPQCTLGVGTLASASLSQPNNEQWDGLSIAMGRIWYRILSDKEIEDNYQEAKQRFNIT